MGTESKYRARDDEFAMHKAAVARLKSQLRQLGVPQSHIDAQIKKGVKDAWEEGVQEIKRRKEGPNPTMQAVRQSFANVQDSFRKGGHWVYDTFKNQTHMQLPYWLDQRLRDAFGEAGPGVLEHTFGRGIDIGGTMLGDKDSAKNLLVDAATGGVWRTAKNALKKLPDAPHSGTKCTCRGGA